MELASQPKQYYRLMLGAKSVHAAECFNGNFVGADFGIEHDLTNELPEKWREFNKKFRPVLSGLKRTPEKRKSLLDWPAGLYGQFARECERGR